MCVALLSLACSDTNGPGAATPGIRVLEGASASDSARGEVTRPLTVEVRDGSGSPLSGAQVQFTPSSASSRPQPTQVLVKPREGYLWQLAPVLDTTDSRGRASIDVQLGARAGTGVVTIAVPALGYRDSVVYTVRPGNPVNVLFGPRDTAVYVGNTFSARAFSVDRFGNRRDTTAGTFGEAIGGITVSPSGLVRGTSLGVALFIARVNNRADTMLVTIVPVGTIAVHQARALVGDSIGVAIVNLDGSGYRRVASETPPREYGSEEPAGHLMEPRWDAAGQRIVYQESQAVVSGNVPGAGKFRMFITDLVAPPRRVLANSPLESEAQPSFSPDGARLYVAGRRTGEADRNWRVRTDGSALELVGDTLLRGVTRPSVSPDGQWLAYAIGEPARIRVQSLVTGAHTALDLPGTSPRWSPDGQRIAYVNGVLRIVRPDGGGDRALLSGGFEPGIDWSPDGRYIIARSSALNGRIEVIDVETTNSYRLPFSANMSQPSWRPVRP